MACEPTGHLTDIQGGACALSFGRGLVNGDFGERNLKMAAKPGRSVRLFPRLQHTFKNKANSTAFILCVHSTFKNKAISTAFIFCVHSNRVHCLCPFFVSIHFLCPFVRSSNSRRGRSLKIFPCSRPTETKVESGTSQSKREPPLLLTC